MTNHEAIQFLNNMIDEEHGRSIGAEGFYRELCAYHVDALRTAIKALSQQTEDAISRQAAIDALNQSINILDATDRIAELPSVTPKAEPCEDAISRQAAIDNIMGEPTDAHYPSWYADKIAELPSVTAKQRWIPVSERLPENSGNYLITYCLRDEIETQEAVYVKDEEDKWLDITGIEITLAVIAWMPLPLPFEPQESDLRDNK